jgi:2-oxoglutarate dehydrogenase E1 component
MQVANCTTPAQYFHLLRRQMFGGEDRRGIRKPLVIFTPKSLLRHPKAVSTIHDLTSGGFQEVLDDPGEIDPQRISRVVFCSGKIYYDLLAAREERKAEQMYRRLSRFILCAGYQGYSAAMSLTAEIIWTQEEPRNMGPWRFPAGANQPLLNDTGRELLRWSGERQPGTGSPSGINRSRLNSRRKLTMGAVARKGKVRLIQAQSEVADRRTRFTPALWPSDIAAQVA